MTASTQCDPQLKPEEKEPCNTQDCIPEIGKEEETSGLNVELHLVEKILNSLAEVLKYIFFKFRASVLHEIPLFSIV